MDCYQGLCYNQSKALVKESFSLTGQRCPVIVTMILSDLLTLIEQVPAYTEFTQKLAESKNRELNVAIPYSGVSVFIAALCRKIRMPALVIAPQIENAKQFFDEVQAWSPQSISVSFFPEPDLSKKRNYLFISDTIKDRMDALSLLAQWNDGSHECDSIPLIVCSASAAASRTISRADFLKQYSSLHVDMEIDPLSLIEKMQNRGYELESVVEVPGVMSRRGCIIDIFPVTGEFPVRIEFFGNKVETMRLFDPKTQRSIRLIENIVIAPATEQYTGSEKSTILDYLPEHSIVIMNDADEFRPAIDMVNIITAESESMGEHDDIGSGNDCHLISWEEFDLKIKNVPEKVYVKPWAEDSSEKMVFSLPFHSVSRYGGRVEQFISDVKEQIADNNRLLIISQQTDRLAEVFNDNDIPVSRLSAIDRLPAPGTMTLFHGSIAEGWALDDILSVYTDSEIFGFIKKRRLAKRRNVPHHLFASELARGDYVVHIEHGIGRYSGLTRVPSDKTEQEYLVLEYAAGDKLYVPVDQIDRVSRYIGGGDEPPRLTRLGTQEWTQTKTRIKKSVADMAEDLVRLYAARETVKGFQFSGDNYWQQELESSFPYIETPDQLEAVNAVKGDMELEKPMDRLVCGDVGYGKTEIALRASFKAVLDGKQVAVLVPTTVLARQHFYTFKERLQAFPVRVEVLSRMCSENEQAHVISELTSGRIDICIGTHRLLQKDIVFKDLGLLIIDEEQRFGVSHKEYFKKLRKEIDVLTLSATPIPRTLHMSLAGIRDLSTIETPPEDRVPITTHIGTYNEELVRKAILREMERNGQVFFVHNRVKTIDAIAYRIAELVPEARISVAHGQMKEDELDTIITQFVNREIDILVTTTIIESGVDMPNVNTIIIDKSDRLGLSQLYQLRGRVGRGDSNAYAYYFFDKNKQLTAPAKKRLNAIMEATELGAGFAIAMKDLEIRGAGNLLGAEQSGYISAVGFDLYCHLLSEAIDELRDKKNKTPVDSVPLSKISIPLDLPIKYYIPEDYIMNPATRIQFYQKCADVYDIHGIEAIAVEMKDRFGVLPEPVYNLLFAVELKLLARHAKVESIVTQEKEIVVYFKKGKTLHDTLLRHGLGENVKVGGRQIRLNIYGHDGQWQQVLKNILEIECEKE